MSRNRTIFESLSSYERDAERFLRESNFFFKVKAFAKCFSRYANPSSEHFGSYINLDFTALTLCYRAGATKYRAR